MHRAIAGALTLLFAAAAWAGELDDAAKQRARDLVWKLGSASVKTRAAAEKDLAAMGVDALATVVSVADRLKTDDAWAALARVLAGMGGGALASVEKLRPDWPKGTAARFEKLPRDVGIVQLAALPDSPADVVAKIEATIRELSARPVIDPSDPGVATIGASGRPAFGRCIRILRDRRATGERKDDDEKARMIAKFALVTIVGPDDVPLVGALVAGGAADAAFVLRDVPGAAASSIFAEAVEQGPDLAICMAIELRAPDERVGRALAKWMMLQTREEMFLVGVAARAAGRAGAQESVASIEAWIRRAPEPVVLCNCYVGLARLGSVKGLSGLVETLEKHPDYLIGGDAGDALNEASGRSYYKGPFRAKGEPEDDPIVAAAKAYREWWESVKDKAKFDPATRKWTF
jgi:hypothetical protein